ncbi:MAG: AsmA family protein, partial [Proteobacteria bacterium]|nr:AsmA family protein [Pseudomonadota bacterium]
MKRWKKIISVVVVLVVAVVVAGIAIIKSLDFNEYRGLIAEQVKNATGRDLSISGRLDLELSLNPALTVEGVSFANAPWGTRPEMIKLKRLSVEIELLPLLTGDIRVKRLVLVGLDLLAETDAKGLGNWELTGPAGKAEKPAKPEPSSGPSGPLPVVNLVHIEDLTVTYRDGKSGQSKTLGLDNLDVRTDGLGKPITVSLGGDFNGLAFQASGRLGSLATLIEGGEPYRVALKATAPGIGLEVNGTVAEPRKVRGLDLKVSVDAKDLGPVAKAAGVTVPKIPPFKLAATVSDLKGGYMLDGLEAKIGESDLKGSIWVKVSGVPRPTVDAKLSSSLIDLDALLPSGAKPPPPADDGKKDAGKRVFPADPLPTDGLKAVDARLQFKARKLVTGGVVIEDIDLALALGAGRLDVKLLKAVVGGGAINGNLVLDGSRPVLELTMNLDAREVDYGAVLKQLKQTKIASGKVDVQVNLKGRGGSVRAIMAGLDGRLRIVTEGGKIESGLLNILSADVLSALPFVDSKGDKDIRCGVVDFDIRKGQAKVKALIFETGGLSLIGTGGINLGDETIDLKFNPRAKKISLLKLAMVPVNIGGTLAEP